MRYKIMRDCCTSGNCFHCSKYGTDPTPHGHPARIEQTTVDDPQIAGAIREAWKNYNATIVEVKDS